MTSLTAKQKSFIRRMAETEELARWGFELLLKRPGYERFFDSLSNEGLFDPQRNPAPVPAEEKGYVRVPFWSCLEYLTAVAKISGEKNDLELATKVMNVVRSVAKWRDGDGHPRENLHTAHKFAVILGLVPNQVVGIDDLKLIPDWLNSRFERMLVGNALDEGALTRFLESSVPEDWDKAVEILRYCTAIRWVGGKELGGTESRPTMAVDDFWIKKLIKSHAHAFGQKVGIKAAEVFLERVRETFGVGSRKLYSQAYRPAIEDNAQNHVWREAENCSIEGLRDVLLSWCEHDPQAAGSFVKKLLGDELEIVRRVGIYIIGQQWRVLRDLLPEFLTPDFLKAGHLHELYNLLSSHFADFSDAEMAATLTTMKAIPLPPGGDDPAYLQKKSQQQWLSAIAGKGYLPADQWLDQLQSDSSLGRISQHPDFDAYMETWAGPGASPYSASELVAFAKAHTLIEKLNSFEERDPFRGPTRDGLTTTLESTVRAAPDVFIQSLPDFLSANRAFQYSLLFGLKQAWDATDAHAQVSWEHGWRSIISFLEQLTANPEFWNGADADGSRRDWGVVSAIADLLNAGTSNDDRAYAPELLPRTQALIGILLDKAPAANEISDDPMTQALNTPKGRAVEALFSQALRACRVSDRASGSHLEAWEAIRPLFDTEAAKCKSANYEFSALTGAYIAQLDYMNEDWIKSRVGEIFSAEFPSNTICAIDGLGYASFTRSVYKLLVEPGILDRGLGYELKGRGGREKLLERIAAAYLWGDEALDSPRFQIIFSEGHLEDLEAITRVLWMVRGETLTREQKERVRLFWSRCLDWGRQFAEPPRGLLCSLALLTCFLETADGEERRLLESVAPYVQTDHNTYEFVAELVRLVWVSTEGVSAVLNLMTATRVPDFDYEDRLKTLVRALAERGRKQDAILYADRLRGLPGMQALFDELRRPN